MELLIAQMFLVYCQRLEPNLTLEDILEVKQDKNKKYGFWVNDYYCSVRYSNFDYITFETET